MKRLYSMGAMSVLAMAALSPSDVSGGPSPAAIPLPTLTENSREKKNGQTRPLKGTTTGLIWDLADYLLDLNGFPPSRAQVWAIYKEQVPNPKEATTATQYSRWVQFHGLREAVKAAHGAGNAEAKAAKAAEKAAAKEAKSAEKDAEKAAKLAEKEAAKQAKIDEKAAKEAERAAKKEAKDAEKLAKAEEVKRKATEAAAAVAAKLAEAANPSPAPAPAPAEEEETEENGDDE